VFFGFISRYGSGFFVSRQFSNFTFSRSFFAENTNAFHLRGDFRRLAGQAEFNEDPALKLTLGPPGPKGKDFGAGLGA